MTPWLAIIWALKLAVSTRALPPATLDVPSYAVDLDAAPGTRWASVLDDFLDAHGTDAFEETYSEWLALLVGRSSTFEPSAMADTANRFLRALETNRPEFHQELSMLSAALLQRKPNTTVFHAPLLALAASGYVILNIFPHSSDAPGTAGSRLRSACTSALIAGPEGRVLHGRSLDYEPRTAMAKTTAEVKYQRGGVVQYICLQPLVYPSALQWLTCQHPGQMSLSVNARCFGRWAEEGATFQELLRRVASPGNMLLGEVAVAAMNTGTYLGALGVLVSAPVVSSNFFILAGAAPRQGAIVTRFGNHSTADVWAMGSGASDGQAPGMRVQTNVDHWVPYASGEYATHRRQHVIDMLNSTAAPVREEDLWRVYRTDAALDGASLRRRAPEDTGAVLRPTTIASLVMSPALGKDTLDAQVWAADPAIQPPVDYV